MNTPPPTKRMKKQVNGKLKIPQDQSPITIFIAVTMRKNKSPGSGWRGGDELEGHHT